MEITFVKLFYILILNCFIVFTNQSCINPTAEEETMYLGVKCSELNLTCDPLAIKDSEGNFKKYINNKLYYLNCIEMQLCNGCCACVEKYCSGAEITCDNGCVCDKGCFYGDTIEIPTIWSPSELTCRKLLKVTTKDNYIMLSGDHYILTNLGFIIASKLNINIHKLKEKNKFSQIIDISLVKFTRAINIRVAGSILVNDFEIRRSFSKPPENFIYPTGRFSINDFLEKYHNNILMELNDFEYRLKNNVKIVNHRLRCWLFDKKTINEILDVNHKYNDKLLILD